MFLIQNGSKNNLTYKTSVRSEVVYIVFPMSCGDEILVAYLNPLTCGGTEFFKNFLKRLYGRRFAEMTTMQHQSVRDAKGFS